MRLCALLGLFTVLVLGTPGAGGTPAVERMTHLLAAPAEPAAATTSLEYATAELESFASPRGVLPARLPSHAGRFADPAILLDGHTYYAYATRSGQLDIPAIASADLVHWSTATNALPALPGWAVRGRTWAPSVVRRGQQYVMWYSAFDRESQHMCITVAVATQPLGPFVDSSERPAICQLERAGSIDPDVFVDDDGAAYLIWKSEDNALGLPTSLWGARLDESGTKVGAARLLHSRSAEWQGLIIEGPALVKADGRYLLFYGANAWASREAAIGYARCDTPLGPCHEGSPVQPWLAGDATALGPSGPQFFRDTAGALRMAYHAWDLCVARMPGCRRALYVDEVAVVEGQPGLWPRPAR